MSLNWIKFPIVFLFSFLQLFGQNLYSKLYNRQFEETIQFYYTNKKQFEKSAVKLNLDPAFLFSIVAPEISQYNSVYNEAELYTLKIFYSQYGKDYSNFSVGYFQMKPSFIESLEQFINSNSQQLKKYTYLTFNDPNSKNTRIVRLERLGSFKWQTKYLEAFCAIVEIRFKSKTFDSVEDKLKFYATAYNSGFNKSSDYIVKMQNKTFFPKLASEKFNYADVSNLFYQRLKK